MLSLLEKHWLFISVILVFLLIYYYYFFKITKQNNIKNINKDLDNIKNNNIFASNESEGEKLSHNHIEARLKTSNTSNKKDWISALNNLNEAQADVVAGNKVNDALNEFGINAPIDDDE